MQHVRELVLVLRLHQRNVRDAAQVSDIEEAVVRGAVARRDAGAIHTEGDRQALQANVMDVWLATSLFRLNDQVDLFRILNDRQLQLSCLDAGPA